MRKTLLRQLDGMKDTLWHNMETIKSLMGTLGRLSKLIETLQENNENNQEDGVIGTLQLSEEEMSKSLKEMLLNTEKLFDIYRKMAESFTLLM